MTRSFTEGDNVSFVALMQTGAGPREITFNGELVDISNIKNNEARVIMDDGLVRDIKASSIVGYDRDRVVGPILFSGEMVRSLRARRKSVTRRLASSPLRNKYAGDFLYVRESFRVSGALDKVPPRSLSTDIERRYEADGLEESYAGGKLRLGMHMPRTFSRLCLEVLNTRTEPLQDITEEDAIEEGILPLMRPKNALAAASGRALSPNECSLTYKNYSDPEAPGYESPIDSFRSLWDSLHSEEGERWEDNPEVLRLEFAVYSKNVDEYLADLQKT